MKRYEAVYDSYLLRRTPAIVRVDGKAFHTLTKGLERPFDINFRESMYYTALVLCEAIQGAKLAFTQSDEISVLISDFDTIRTEAWFGYRVQKMVSIAAATATAAFGQAWHRCFEKKAIPLFDARVFSVPFDEVANYFIWRQQDATRNSIQMAARSVFSHKKCLYRTCDDLQEMLYNEKDINWNDYPTALKRGSCIVKMPRPVVVPAGPKKGETIERMTWSVDDEPPIFTQDRQYIERVLEVDK